MVEWRNRDSFDAAAWTAVDAIDEVAANIKAGVLLQEPEMNGAMASHLATAFNKQRIAGIRWHGRHLTSIGRNTEENKIGADLIIGIKINLPDYRVEKGLLIQNKRNGRCTTAEQKRVIGQIDKMTRHSCSKWVCILSGQRFRFDSGTTVKARAGRFSRDEARIPAFTFFRDFFRCKTGDDRITLKRVAELYREADEDAEAVLLDGHE